MMDFDQQEALLQERRKRYAQQLQGAQNAPQGRMVGNVYVAPNFLEYAAQALRGVGAMRGEQAAEQELKSLQGQRSEGTQKALAEFLRQSQGTPENAPADGMGPVIPAQAPNMQGAYAALLNAPDAGLRNMGMQGIARIPEMEAQREARLQDRQMAAEQRMAELQMQHQLRIQQMEAQNASRQQMAEAQREFQREMIKLRSSMGGGGAQPYFQPVQTAQGVMAFNARTGRVEPVMGPGGHPIIGAQADPTLQGQLAGAKTGATTAAKYQAERALEAPQVVSQGEQTIKLVDDLLAAPGFKQAVGASRLLGVQKIPGTAAKDFDVRLDQLKGQQFLQAFESLKGGGAITEVEGKKATDAIARMDAASSEAEFTKAAREFQQVIRTGVDRAKRASGGASGNWGAPPQPSGSQRIRFDAQGNIIK
jgi:hypothetical protein